MAKEFGEAACIGETVEVDGLTVPYRPAAVDIFSGIVRHKHGFVSQWALLQLNTLVGNVFARGGYLGYYTKNAYGFYKGDTDHTWALDVWEEDGLINDLAMAHGFPANQSRYQKVRGTEGVYPNAKRTIRPMLCMMCETAPCAEICPTGASAVREDGIVTIDKKECIGCGSCQTACPYDARSLRESGEALAPIPLPFGAPQPPAGRRLAFGEYNGALSITWWWGGGPSFPVQ